MQNPAYGLCSQGVNGVNSDVVMILHLNPANNSLSILSIPRDLFVPNARSDGANKIDAALYQGPDQLIAAIEEDFGIPIQHFVELNFDSFINVVNALGGIKMYFPEPVYDAYSGLNIQTTGCIALNGTQALQVVRARHLQYKGPGVTTTDPDYWPQEAQSDLARIRRDHEFLRVLATAVKAKGLSNPITDQQLVSGVVGQLTVDSGFSAVRHDQPGARRTTTSTSTPRRSSPCRSPVDQFGSYVYQGGSYGDIEFPSEPQDHDAVDQFLGLKSSNEDTYSGGALPSPSTVTVSVHERIGRLQPGDGHRRQACRRWASTSGRSATATPVGQEAETVVYYSSKTPAELAAAQAVANSMSGAVIMADGPDPGEARARRSPSSPGTDFSVNPPPAATDVDHRRRRGRPAGAEHDARRPRRAAPGTRGTVGSGAFQRPTPTVEPLAALGPPLVHAERGRGHLSRSGSRRRAVTAVRRRSRRRWCRAPGRSWRETGPRPGRRSTRPRPRRSGSGRAGPGR